MEIFVILFLFHRFARIFSPCHAVNCTLRFARSIVNRKFLAPRHALIGCSMFDVRCSMFIQPVKCEAYFTGPRRALRYISAFIFVPLSRGQ
jgi:hypothetical protein